MVTLHSGRPFSASADSADAPEDDEEWPAALELFSPVSTHPTTTAYITSADKINVRRIGFLLSAGGHNTGARHDGKPVCVLDDPEGRRARQRLACNVALRWLRRNRANLWIRRHLA